MARRVFRAGGTVLLVWDEGEHPLFPDTDKGGGRIAAFYGEIARGYAETAKGLCRAAEKELLRWGEDGRRGSFPFYRLASELRIVAADADFFAAIRTLSLRRGSALLAENRVRDLFFRQSGYFCTAAALRLQGYRLPRGRGELFYEDGRLVRIKA